jgi:ubiquinone/menaquinone biosynthesis C-methylase UbiE
VVESGPFYKTFIDPLLLPMRKRITGYILPGEKVIDIACGTGAQVFEMASVAGKIFGIDISESMIQTAQTRKLNDKILNVDFEVADATNLFQFNSGDFDISTISLALHQFDPELYTPILNEMKRIAHKILIVDYAVPLPRSLTGYTARFIEFLAGREHNRNFRKFYKLGGLEPILENHQLKISSKRIFSSGIFQLVGCLPEGTDLF